MVKAGIAGFVFSGLTVFVSMGSSVEATQMGPVNNTGEDAAIAASEASQVCEDGGAPAPAPKPVPRAECMCWCPSKQGHARHTTGCDSSHEGDKELILQCKRGRVPCRIGK